jgi:hypothetical protein
MPVSGKCKLDNGKCKIADSGKSKFQYKGKSKI